MDDVAAAVGDKDVAVVVGTERITAVNGDAGGGGEVTGRPTAPFHGALD